MLQRGIIYVVVCLSALGLGIFISEQRGNIPESHYENYAAAEAAGAMAEGWLPRFMPKSAFNIDEKHNEKTRVIEATFQYMPLDFANVIEACKENAQLQFGVQYLCTHEGRPIAIDLFANGTGKLYSVQVDDERQTD